MDINERIQNIVNELFDGNKALFAKSINEPVTTISNVLSKRKTIPSSSILMSITNAVDGLNSRWLLTGEGDMMGSNNEGECEFTTRLLPLSAMGGSMTGFADKGVSLQDCELVVSPIKNVDYAITVYGESMCPEYPNGSRILIKKINPNVFIDWGKTYVLDTSNGAVVKEIHKSSIEGHVSCHSINPDPKFEPFDVPLSEVYGMYKVLMCMVAKSN